MSGLCIILGPSIDGPGDNRGSARPVYRRAWGAKGFNKRTRIIYFTYENNIFLFLTAKQTAEIEFLHGAFESYKSRLHSEMDDKWRKKEENQRHDYERQTQEQVHEVSKYKGLNGNDLGKQTVD